MADANATAGTKDQRTSSFMPDDLIVEIRDGHTFTEFHGTSAMLESEELIPKDFDWPQGYDDLHWQSGQFDYWLRRERPPGAKGPRKQFIDCDWFFLRQDLTDKPSFEQQSINRKMKELQNAIYHSSPEYKAERDAMWEHYWEAVHDKAFQAFKATIPGLIRPKRGRKTS